MRSPNKTSRIPGGVWLTFTRPELAMLKFNEPGPSGVLGGYAREENYIVTNTNHQTLRVWLDDVHLARLIRYVQPTYGSGGPNGRLRRACIPALQRIGISIDATIKGAA